MRMKDVLSAARERLQGVCRVCPACNGKACAGEFPGMGGIRSGASFMANISALNAIHLKVRLLHEVRDTSTACTLLGLNLSMPVLIAPIGGMSYNIKEALPEGPYTNAVVAGAKAEGLIACTGDAMPEIVFTEGLRAIKEQEGYGIPFIKPWADKALFDERLERAADTGCSIVGMDIDMAATRARGGYPFAPRSAAELSAEVKKVHDRGLKFILKGILCPEDARIAEDCGCDAIVVSNHGGRILEAAPSSAEVLPSIAAAVPSMTVLADGGIRHGSDILKMLALGADGVLIGRPFVIGAVGGEAEGVRAVAARFANELHEALRLTGCASVNDANASILLR